MGNTNARLSGYIEGYNRHQTELREAKATVDEHVDGGSKELLRKKHKLRLHRDGQTMTSGICGKQQNSRGADE